MCSGGLPNLPRGILLGLKNILNSVLYQWYHALATTKNQSPRSPDFMDKIRNSTDLISSRINSIQFCLLFALEPNYPLIINIKCFQMAFAHAGLSHRVQR